MKATDLTPEKIGRRVRQARELQTMSQSALADVLNLDRSALARIESGQRKVSVIELSLLAESLKLPFDWFLDPEPAVTAGRRAALEMTEDTAFDRMLSRITTGVRELLDSGILSGADREILPFPTTHARAEFAAAELRGRLGNVSDPIHGLSQAAEILGLLTFSFSFESSPFDGSMVEVESSDGSQSVGVVLLDGTQSAGRRRFTLAHELGHWVFGDELALDCGFISERESMIDSFATHLLLPRRGILATWNQEKHRHGERDAALIISARFRTSWTATLGQLNTLGLIDRFTFERLRAFRPTPGDFAVLGWTWEPELAPVDIPVGYQRDVLHAYLGRQLTTGRALDLLYGTLQESELPTRSERERSSAARTRKIASLAERMQLNRQ